MPENLEVNLNNVEKIAKKEMEKEGAKNISFEKQDIAFGLKALMMKMAWQEEKDTNIIEDKLEKIKGVSSVKIEDYRRAFG